MTVLELGLAAFFGATMIVVATLSTRVAERRQVGRTFELATNTGMTVDDIEQSHLAVPFLQRVGLPIFASFASFTRRITPVGMMERIQVEVVRAGLQQRWDAGRVMAAKLGALGVFGVGAFVAALLVHLAPVQGLTLALVFAFVGYYLPEWIVRSKAGDRQNAIRRSLPDALDLLAITVEAGLAFDSAVARVAAHREGPLSEELGRLLHELQIGRTRSAALRDLGDRTSVPELKSFTMAMIQADTFGVSISKMLHEQAKEARIARRQRAEERAQKVQVKILFPLLSCIFPSMFVVLLGPAAISIYQNMFRY